MNTRGPSQPPPKAPNATRTNGSLALAIPDELVEAIAARVAELVADRLATPPPAWLDVEAAAEHLACQPHRIYDLVSEGRLRRAKDGRRLLFRREWLDACLEEDAR